MAERPSSELLGANDKSLNLAGESVETDLQIDPVVLKKAEQKSPKRSFLTTPIEGLRSSGDESLDNAKRVFLNIENIRGSNDAAIFQVYLNLPRNADPSEYDSHRAGVLSLFGARHASAIGKGHGGNGISKVLEITRLVHSVGFEDSRPNHMSVLFVPFGDVRAEDKISVGRVSLYLQS